jgi:VWFA-related protein
LFPLSILAALFLASAPSVAAQQPSAEVQQPIQSSSDLVLLDVNVIDRSGNFYGGLARQNFRILDNGVEKPVLFFAPVEAPARVVILVETGPAVFLIHDQHMLALSSLLDGLASDDQAALFAYAESAREVLPFTADKTALRNSIGESQYMVGMDQLNFYDSLRALLDWLPAGPEKKAIVILGTGLDDSPPSHWDLLERRLRADSVVIFAVGLGGPLRGDAPVKPAKKSKKKGAQPSTDAGPNPGFARADQALRSLAQITGGRAYFPQSPQDFAPAYREIAAAVRHQYLLGIAPDHDGLFHKLSIETLDPSGQQAKHGEKTPQYRTFYREGYLAPSQ